MPNTPVLISGLAGIADSYDAMICDVWGVLHDGARAYPKAIEALERFRHARGRVVLLTNAPRPPAEIAVSLKNFGIFESAYDAIVTSGGVAREDLMARTRSGRLKMMHLGPERDVPVFRGLDIALTGPEEAELVLCTGLYDDDHETPDDYAATLAALKARNLTMICANPDILVPRGGVLVHCAGGVARAYEALGGEVIYYGKPKPAIYQTALAAAGNTGTRTLVVGDGLVTDIAGAAVAGLDALFVAGGLHKDDIGPVTAQSIEAFFARHAMTARAAVDMFQW